MKAQARDPASNTGTLLRREHLRSCPLIFMYMYVQANKVFLMLWGWCSALRTVKITRRARTGQQSVPSDLSPGFISKPVTGHMGLFRFSLKVKFPNVSLDIFQDMCGQTHCVEFLPSETQYSRPWRRCLHCCLFWSVSYQLFTVRNGTCSFNRTDGLWLLLSESQTNS